MAALWRSCSPVRRADEFVSADLQMFPGIGSMQMHECGCLRVDQLPDWDDEDGVISSPEHDIVSIRQRISPLMRRFGSS